MSFSFFGAALSAQSLKPFSYVEDFEEKNPFGAWEAVHELGVKILCAGYFGTFDAVGDLQDILVHSGIPSHEEANRWHSIGHKIWSYNNPQGGVEKYLADMDIDAADLDEARKKIADFIVALQ